MTDFDWTDQQAAIPRLAKARTVVEFHLPWRRPRLGQDRLSEQLHTPDGSLIVTVVIEPELDALGRCYPVHGYSTVSYLIALREWNEQVLLHELLHAILGHIIPESVPGYWQVTPHNVINAVEVALAPLIRLREGLAAVAVSGEMAEPIPLLGLRARLTASEPPDTSWVTEVPGS